MLREVAAVEEEPQGPSVRKLLEAWLSCDEEHLRMRGPAIDASPAEGAGAEVRAEGRCKLLPLPLLKLKPVVVAVLVTLARPHV